MELVAGQTPLDEDELAGLIPALTTRAELNAFEQSNIYDAAVWAHKSRTLKKDLLSVKSLTLLHSKMFNKTWRWAGQFRQTAKNIGVEVHDVQNQLGQLIGNANYWLDNETFSMTEIAIRVHHKLVWIHLFPNGNGRHARLVADLLLHFKNQPSLSWGGASLDLEGTTRNQYLAALKSADLGNLNPLLSFATQ